MATYLYYLQVNFWHNIIISSQISQWINQTKNRSKQKPEIMSPVRRKNLATWDISGLIVHTEHEDEAILSITFEMDAKEISPFNRLIGFLLRNFLSVYHLSAIIMTILNSEFFPIVFVWFHWLWHGKVTSLEVAWIIYIEL